MSICRTRHSLDEKERSLWVASAPFHQVARFITLYIFHLGGFIDRQQQCNNQTIENHLKCARPDGS